MHDSHQTKSAQASLIIVGVCAFFAFLVLSIPSITRAEYIESFISDISINKDSSLNVTESISYVFEGEKHGIYRCILTEHPEKSSSLLKERYIDITIQGVQMDKGYVPYVTNTEREQICVRVGDPDATITGSHTYEIQYTVYGAVSYPLNAGADLYWNVTGNGWQVLIKSVEARVSSPDSILMRERACYRGREGKTDSCKSVTEANGVISFKDAVLNASEGMTIAQALNRSNIVHDERERYKNVLLWGVPILILLLVLAYVLYAYKTKYKTDKPIIPQYEPYPGVKPMYAGLLFDKRLDPRDITAGIVYLAEQGFIKIRKTERKALFFFEVDDYEITYTGKSLESLDSFSKEILPLFFGGYPVESRTISLSELKDRSQSNSKLILTLKMFLLSDLKKSGFFTDFFFTRRTRKGYEALDHLKGFKDYLSVTESQRYIFHNAPEKNAEQFMEYLPYAIAFGVEKQWAKTFEGITIPNPRWYEGESVGSFSSTNLTTSLGAFSTAFTSSSGASASNGGGSSGGGAGGGGGGSW